MRKLIFAVAVAVTVASNCVAECVKPSGTTFVKDAVQKYVDSGELPGAISILYNNGVQEVACVGYSDVRSKRKITLDDVFMQCSQTKGFCGVTIAILVEEGKISLDDPVSKYLPEFKGLWVYDKKGDKEITLKKAENVLTVRMVMNHTGGFPFELPGHHAVGGWSRRMPLRSVAATAAAQPILFEPGTKVQYSNVGIDIGAAIVEIVTGKRWEDFLDERVLNPLGMTVSSFWPTDKQLETKIELNTVKANAPAEWLYSHEAMNRPYNDRFVFSSAGAGLWTTARDQLKFYKMLMNLGVGDNGVRILKEETVKKPSRRLFTSERAWELFARSHRARDRQRRRVVRARRRMGVELLRQLAQEAAQTLGCAALRQSASLG
ncbi:MAG: beta-lactamase family protein [Kiritimatiellae bacterium]|nr:beta-lactamase family protein [Kiritimatiellia bacterium]